MFKSLKLFLIIMMLLPISGITTVYAKKVYKQTTHTKKIVKKTVSLKEEKIIVKEVNAAKISYSYRVFGKKYHVLSSSKDYQQTGLASWYGPRFNGRHTSSGERFNMYSMTAAHKSLPLSTYVLVKNVRNGKSVVVKINDRGPFVSNRVIDLSYGAAKKIGMVGVGVTKVSIKAIRA